MQKTQRRTPRTHFRMNLQEQRSISNTNKRCPLTNRCRKVLLQTTAAPVMGLWLLQARLPLLLLFSALQRPTVSSKLGHHSGHNLFIINARTEHSPGDNLSVTFRYLRSNFIQTFQQVIPAKGVGKYYLKLWIIYSL